ncbi:MAG TPA: Ni/Fe-hydrogenase cytochrome b subunit [Vicinamibacterales bacterium]|nr:Ni/Fe-hydrogenase cytochrome b subunit [Vicinamibacterales bacterium]
MLRAEPVGGSISTPGTRALLGVFGLGALLIAWRLVAGLGSATALNDGYPLGLWIAFDVVTGTALACGGYSIALLVYIFNNGRYHALVRPALLTSALGYSLAGFGVFIDIGRWWSIWKVPVYFWRWNFNSALLEVALCIMSYVVVLWIELSPAFFEKWQQDGPSFLRGFSRTALPIVEKLSVPVIALGVLLPTMHQSSLGTLMLLAGVRLHPLWNTPLLPLLFLISCVSMGFAVVVFESALSASVFRREPETAMLATLAGVMVPLQVVYVAVRLGDLAVRGRLGLLVQADTRSFMVLVEFALALAPAAMLASRASRRDLGQLFRAALVLMFAGAVYRFDTYLVAFTPGANWSYFPSVSEMAITIGLVAFEIFAYVAIVKMFPILSGARQR